MTPYILKWDAQHSDMAGHLYKEDHDKPHNSVAIVYANDEAEKERITRYFEVANLAWEQVQGI